MIEVCRKAVPGLNYIILDLEWNQCPYGKKKEDPKLPFEIIEIGAVKLDAYETIRPVLYRKLHYMTRNVIHMTEKDFEGKRTFPYVFADFLIWCGDSPVFCTWGPGDLTELQRCTEKLISTADGKLRETFETLTK